MSFTTNRALCTLILLLAGLAFARPSAEATHKHHKRSAAYGPKSRVTSAAGLKWYGSITDGKNSSGTSSYKCYSGPASNFPPITDWINYNSMLGIAKFSSFFQKSVNDTVQQVQWIDQSIQTIAKLAKVDARFILATIIQESTGKVTVECTPGEKVPNCGLMQAYNSSSFDPSNPQKSIYQMIEEGTQGTKAKTWNGPGLVQHFNEAQGTNAQTNGNLYATAREYNSGSFNASNLSAVKYGVASYVSDIANRLTGWNSLGSGAASCNFNAQPTPTNGGVPAPGPTQGASPSNCNKWIECVPNFYCKDMATASNISLATFYKLNPVTAPNCNVWADYYYCVGTAS